MEFYKILEKILDEKSLSIPEAARSCGLPDSTVRSIFDRKQKKIALNVAFKLSKGLNVSLERLNGEVNNGSKEPHTGSGISTAENEVLQKYLSLDEHGREMVNLVIEGERRRMIQAAQPAPDPEPEENIIRFPMPFYLQPSSAGFGDWADSEYAEKVMLVKEPPFGAAFIIPVNGDSMEPTYPDGCKVFVRPQHEVREGQVGIFYMDGKLWIKELGDGELLSHNPDYPPQPFQEDLRCWGLVVGICDDSYFEH